MSITHMALPANNNSSIQPLTREEVEVLSALHIQRGIAAAARTLEMRKPAAERVMRTVLRSRPWLVESSQDRLSTNGLVLVAASREYHRELEQLPWPFQRHHTTMHLAAIGSGYHEVASTIAQEPDAWVLRLTETTPQQALRLLEVGEAAAAYTWTGPGLTPDRDVHEFDIAEEILSIAGPADQVHEFAEGNTDVIGRMRWVTTPSGLPFVRAAIEHYGCRGAAIEVVQCAMMVSGLTMRGTHTTLASPLSETFGVQTAQCDPAIARRLRLFVNPSALSAEEGHRLAGALRASYRQLAASRYPNATSRKPWVVADSDPPPRGAEAATTGRAPMALAPTVHHRPTGSGLTEEDLTQLRAIHHSGSVNQAAKDLLITQSALSRRIHKIEARLGMTLLVRTSTGSQLTTDAQQIVRLGGRALQTFHRQVAMQSAHPNAARQMV